MPAAIPIAMGIAAVGQVAGAKIASNAAKGAAKIQTQAGERAMGVNQRVYDDQRALFQPYIQSGQQAMGSMMQRYGNAGGPMAPQSAPMSPNVPQTGQNWAGEAHAAPRPFGGPMSMGSVGQPQAERMVQLEAPTGERGEFPESKAQRMIAAGARRIY